MIGGRFTGRMFAAGTPAARRRTDSIAAKTLSPAPRRSSKSFIDTIMKAALESASELKKLKPGTATTCLTPGSAATAFSTCSTTCSVRFAEAPSGSCSSTKKAPWSSSGRKPPGVVLKRMPVPAPAAATATSDSTATRTRRRTAAT